MSKFSFEEDSVSLLEFGLLLELISSFLIRLIGSVLEADSNMIERHCT